MKSRDEIVIIMLQWMHLYTLGSRGSRELKNLNSLNFFTSRSEVKFQRENTSLFKEEISPISWAIEAVVGVDLKRRGGGFTWRRRSFRIGFD